MEVACRAMAGVRPPRDNPDKAGEHDRARHGHGQDHGMMVGPHRYGGDGAIRPLLRWFTRNRCGHGAADSRTIGVVQRVRRGLRHVLSAVPDGWRRCGCRLIVGFRRAGHGAWREQASDQAGVVDGRFRRHGFAFHAARRVHPVDPCAQVRPCVRVHGDQVEPRPPVRILAHVVEHGGPDAWVEPVRPARRAHGRSDPGTRMSATIHRPCP